MGKFYLDRRVLLASVIAMAGLSPGRARALGSDIYAEAALFGFAAFEFIRSAWAMAAPNASRPIRFNQLINRPELLDHRARAITTPNADTLYSTARIDLSAGPVSLSLPAVEDRYFSLACLDAFTDNFINVRAGSRPTEVVIVPPDTRAAISAPVVAINAPTMDLWVIFRIAPSGPGGLAGAQAIQRDLTIRASAVPLFPVAPVAAADPRNFVAVVNAVLARTARSSSYRRHSARFATTGLRPVIEPQGATLDDDQYRAWANAIPAMLGELRDSPWADLSRHGWQVPDRHLGRFGDNHRLRARTALSGLGALAVDEAFYASAYTDSSGAALDGGRHYRLTIARDVPADAFWSVSAYRREPDGRQFFAKNALGRYSIGSQTVGVTAAMDGQTAILIGPSPDPALPDSHWLPTAAGPMTLVFRAYRPRAELIEGRWPLPLVIPLRAG